MKPQIKMSTSIAHYHQVKFSPNVMLSPYCSVIGDVFIGAGSSVFAGIGNRVTIGHGAIVHGCTIEDNVLIGMGAIVMDDAIIGTNCLVGAGALITQGKVFEPGSLIMGSPARAVRTLSDEEIETMITVAAEAYAEAAQAMTNDGLMYNPPIGANVWPVSNGPSDLMSGGIVMGGLF